MTRWYAGFDPGPSSGISLVGIDDHCDPLWVVVQCNGDAAMELLGVLLNRYHPRALAYEEFVVSNRAGTKGKNAQLTRALADRAPGIVDTWSPGTHIVTRRATDVMLWATPKRLEAAKFPLGTKFKDVQAAGKHALFCAVRDGKERDPLL